MVFAYFKKNLLRLPLVTLMLLLSLFTLASSAPAVTPSMSNERFEEASKAYKDKKYSESLNLFTQLRDSGVSNDYVHYYMALCYQSLNQIAPARQEFWLAAHSKDVYLKANARSGLYSLDTWNKHRLYNGNGNNFSRYGAHCGHHGH